LEDDEISIIADEEYKQLNLGKISFAELDPANIDKEVTLEGLANQSYKFNTASLTQPNYNGFTVNVSNASSYGGVNYTIIIKRDGNAIYNKEFDETATLAVKSQNNSEYEVIILNVSTNLLKYRVRINSYTR